MRLCKEMQGAALGFVQSDEISVLLHGYKRLASKPWFDNEVQKVVSVSASIAAASSERMVMGSARSRSVRAGLRRLCRPSRPGSP